MVQYRTNKIETSLIKKGFNLSHGSKHKLLILYVGDKKTSVFTFLSHGINTYNDALLGEIKKQLKLENKQELCDLIECPMKKEDYIEKLIRKGVLPASTSG